jgi:molecular chaperone GrpE (heat shock protein)
MNSLQQEYETEKRRNQD